jgi:cyclohexa-1,5-dienecarbonyl-CoA hydratase
MKAASSTISGRREREGGIHRITLTRPPGNVIDIAMVNALRDEIRGLSPHPDLPTALRLVVFDAEGPNFSYGASVHEHMPELIMKLLPGFHAFVNELEALGIPTAALVRGHCLGGGMELAIACGRVIASPGATFGVPEVKLGVFPPIAATLLAWRTGGSKATEVVLSGRVVSGEEAAALGIADVCVADPEQELARWYDEVIAPRSAVALRFAWRAVRTPVRRALADDLPEIEHLYLKDLLSYMDPEEGIRAFIEKRAPVWRDR